MADPTLPPPPKLLVVGGEGLCRLFAALRPGSVGAADALAFAEAFSGGGFTAAVVAIQTPWVDGSALLGTLRRRFPELPLYVLGDVAVPGVLRAVLDARVADVFADTLEGCAALIERLPTGALPLGEDAVLRERVRVLEAEIESLGRAGSDSSRAWAEVAHDLREPLRTSRLLLERVDACLAQADGDGAAALIARLYDATARLEEQVDSALAAVAGRAELPGVSSADRVLDEVLEQLQALVEESGATIERSPLPEVSIHPHQLRQVFQNLIANALRYGGDPPRVQVSATLDDRAWVLAVRDHGPGIPVQEREAIFRALTRLGGADAPAGHGLGLAICRKVVERVGGSIRVEDADGGGSVFLARLPASAADEPTERVTILSKA